MIIDDVKNMDFQPLFEVTQNEEDKEFNPAFYTKNIEAEKTENEYLLYNAEGKSERLNAHSVEEAMQKSQLDQVVKIEYLGALTIASENSS